MSWLGLQKSNLLPLLEGAVPPVEQPPSDAVNIVDGMAMQQACKRLPAKFGKLAELLLRRLLLDSMQQAESTRDIVFDSVLQGLIH